MNYIIVTIFQYLCCIALVMIFLFVFLNINNRSVLINFFINFLYVLLGFLVLLFVLTLLSGQITDFIKSDTMFNLSYIAKSCKNYSLKDIPFINILFGKDKNNGFGFNNIIIISLIMFIIFFNSFKIFLLPDTLEKNNYKSIFNIVLIILMSLFLYGRKPLIAVLLLFTYLTINYIDLS